MAFSSPRQVHTVQLAQGPVQYVDIGDGPVLLFVHGILVNGEMWRKVYPPLAAYFRCVVLTLPLGGHAAAMRPDADLTPPGLAKLIDHFMATLNLNDVTIIGCDTGGALSQLVAVNHPERLARLVLTNCDAYDDFPPTVLKPFQIAFRVPGCASFAGLLFRLRPVQRLLYRLLAHAPLEPQVGEGYFRGFIQHRAVRHDARKVVVGVSNRYTVDAARHFPEFGKPVLIAWGQDDRNFRPHLGERLAQAFPYSRLEPINNSKTLVSEDQPEILTALIADFMHEPALA